MRYVHLTWLTVAWVVAAACGRAEGASTLGGSVDSMRADSIARARQDSINRAQPGYVVDSARSPEEDLRRFREMLGGAPVTSLIGGARSRDELLRRFVAAVAARDTADLRAMVLNAHEYAYLVYPSSPYMHPPYENPAGLVWMQITNPSVSGFKRLLQRRGGVRFRLDGYTCDPKADREGKNLLWRNCVLHLSAPEYGFATERWFGSIIERDGQFKFVSYANQF
jgi:hypothetical protein